MNTGKITEGEIADIKISSLPSRPTAPKAFGGRGYTASDMKAAFDRLPLFIIERLNSLIEDIAASPEESVCQSIKTGINDTHTLAMLFADILSGVFCEYLSVGEESFSEWKARVDSRLLGE